MNEGCFSVLKCRWLVGGGVKETRRRKWKILAEQEDPIVRRHGPTFPFRAAASLELHLDA